MINYCLVPVMSFETAKYTVKEDGKKLSLSIVRTGDVSCTVSVICYTRQQTATVMADFLERVSLVSHEELDM